MRARRLLLGLVAGACVAAGAPCRHRRRPSAPAELRAAVRRRRRRPGADQRQWVDLRRAGHGPVDLRGPDPRPRRQLHAVGLAPGPVAVPRPVDRLRRHRGRVLVARHRQRRRRGPRLPVRARRRRGGGDHVQRAGRRRAARRLPAPVALDRGQDLHGLHHPLVRPADHQRPRRPDRAARPADHGRLPVEPVGHDRALLRLRPEHRARRSSPSGSPATACRPSTRIIELPPDFAPNTNGQGTSDQIASFVARTPWTIGYDEFGYAKVYGNDVAWIQNAVGRLGQALRRQHHRRPRVGHAAPRPQPGPAQRVRQPEPAAPTRSRRTATWSPSARAAGTGRPARATTPTPASPRRSTTSCATSPARARSRWPTSATRPLPPQLSQFVADAIGRMWGRAPETLTIDNCANPRFDPGYLLPGGEAPPAAARPARRRQPGPRPLDRRQRERQPGRPPTVARRTAAAESAGAGRDRGGRGGRRRVRATGGTSTRWRSTARAWPASAGGRCWSCCSCCCCRSSAGRSTASRNGSASSDSELAAAAVTTGSPPPPEVEPPPG